MKNKFLGGIAVLAVAAVAAMKKKFLGGIAVLVVAIVAAVNVNLNSQKSDLSDVALVSVEALACENTVDTSGGLIVVTVCNRKTSPLDALLKLKCNTESTSSCQFTNVCD